MIPLPFGLSLATVRIGALVAVVVGAGVAGWTARGWREDAARLEADREAHATYVATVEGWAAALQFINGQRDQDRQQAADDRREFDRRVKDARRGPLAVANVECPVSGAELGVGASGSGLPVASVPVHRVAFTADFVRLWNDGLAVGLPATLRAGRSDGPGDGAGFLDPEDILDNLAENGEACNELRSRLLAVQAWARSIGAMK